MSRKRSFILKIDIPVFLAFILFSGLIFFYLIPGFEKTMMEQKRKLMQEIAASAHSILTYYHSQERNGALSTENAMDQAKSAIGNLRYGEELKDYLWITDTLPRMVIHPYRPDLNGADLTEYRDSRGKQVFVEFADAVSRDGESFVDYMWQWNDDTTQNVPKLSYVRLFRPWGWIIGTGIYLQDVKTEITRIEQRALLISGVIGILIILLLIIVTTQSHRIEQRRKKAEEEVLKSHELYRTLAEATSEGVLIWSADGLQANKTLLTWLGYKEEELKNIIPGTILNAPEFREFHTSDSFADQLETNKFIETEVTTRDGGIINAYAELSTIKMGGNRAVLLVLRPSKAEGREISISFPALLFRDIVTGFFRISPGRKFRFIYASERMARMLGYDVYEDLSTLSLEHFFADAYELEYFKSMVDNCPAYTLRDVKMKKKDGSVFTADMNITVSGSAGGDTICEGTLDLMPGRDQAAIFRHNDPDVFIALITSKIEETGKPDNVITLKKLFNTCRGIAISMIKAGDDASSVSLFISAVSDEICRRVIDLCLAEAGKPPCRFAFILTGSAGRMEQTLSTDQDNAIIFEECGGDKLKKATDYFVTLGQKVNMMLDLTGFRYCKGLNMAGNPRWSQPVNVWKDYFSGWTRNPGPAELLDISIYFDFRFCAGDPGLAEELRLFIKKHLGTNDIFFHHMALALKTLSPALNKSSAGADLKKILMPLTSVIRLYALKHGTGGYSTMERLALLYRGNHLDTGLLRISARAWDDLTSMRLAHQSACIDNGIEPDNTVDLSLAGKCHYAVADRSVATVRELMLKAGTDFMTDIF